MATISAKLSSLVNGAGKSEILLRFVGGRNNVYRAKSGIFVASNRWNAKEGHIIIPRIETSEQRELMRQQKQLNDLCEMLIETYCQADKSAVNKQWLTTAIDRYHHPDKYSHKDADIYAAFDDFMKRRKLSPARQAHYMVLGRIMRRYEAYCGLPLSLGTMNTDVIDDFVAFLKDEHRIYTNPQYAYIYKQYPETRKILQRGENTVNMFLKMLRSFILWANSNDLTTNDPFKRYQIPECVYGTPYYISIEERDRVFRTNLSNHPTVAAQRDIFVFQCLIGCRVGDLLKMTKSNVINGAIEYVPRKTKDERPVRVRVPLNATARAILARYADREDEKLLPFISEQKYNEAIKRIFRAAGLYRWVTVINPTTREEEKRRLYDIASSHIARRTFIGNLYKQVKDPNLVGALSGHKEGSKAFARYRDIDEDMRVELVNLLDK